MRKGVLVLLCAFAAIGSIAGAPDARADVPVLVLDGKGYGHGVGLSQHAARYMADAGMTASQILATFYPGTVIEQRSGTVRVSVLAAPERQAVLSFPSGGAVHSAPPGAPDGPGFPVEVGPGGSVVISFDGAAYHVSPVVTAQAASEAVTWRETSSNGCLPFVPCSTTTTTGGPPNTEPPGCGVLCIVTTTTVAPTTVTTAPPGSDTTSPPSTDGGGTTTGPPSTAGNPGSTSSAPVWAVPAGGGVTAVPARGRSYRGAIEATGAAGPLRLVNQLDVETYLKGMGEVPGSWPVNAIAAQAVAARTYALRAMAASGEICDYDLCQVYIGAGNESAGQNAAVDATRSQVITYGGALAAAVYSAEAGGVSATTFEGFGTPDGTYPYLTTVRYDTPDPLPWHVEVALSDIASRFGYAGTVSSVTVSETGPSGRALHVTLDGDHGPLVVEGRQFASELALRSTLFTSGTGTAAVAPPPPPPSDGAQLQALPDDAAVKAAALAGPRVRATTKATEPGAAVARAVTHIVDRPAAWAAVLLLAALTGAALAQYGPPQLRWSALRRGEPDGAGW